MSEYQNVDEIEEMLRRFGADLITQQAALDQNLFNLNLPSEDEYDPPPAKQRMARPIPVVRARGIDRVNVKNGAPGNLGMVAGGASRNPASSVKSFSGRQLPKPLAGGLVFAIDEMEMAQGPDAVDRVVEVFKSAGSGAARYLARSWVNPEVSKPTADVAAADTSMEVPNAAGYWTGQSYDVVVAAAPSTVVGQFRVLDVVPDFDDSSAEIKFDSANGQIGFIIDVSEQDIYLLGQGDEDLRVGSIADVTDSSIELYDIDQERFPAGVRHSLGTTFGHEDGRRMCSVVSRSSGRKVTHWFTSPLGMDGIVNDQIDNVRFIMGQGDGADMDPYSDAMVPVFNGLPIIAEDTYDDDVLDVGNADEAILREYWAYRPRRPDASAVNSGDDPRRRALILDHDNLQAKALFDGAYGSVFRLRRAWGRFTDVTTN